MIRVVGAENVTTTPGHFNFVLRRDNSFDMTIFMAKDLGEVLEKFACQSIEDVLDIIIEKDYALARALNWTLADVIMARAEMSELFKDIWDKKYLLPKVEHGIVLQIGTSMSTAPGHFNFFSVKEQDYTYLFVPANLADLLDRWNSFTVSGMLDTIKEKSDWLAGLLQWSIEDMQKAKDMMKCQLFNVLPKDLLEDL